MRSTKFILLFLCFLSLFPIIGQAKYTIKGKVNLQGDWQPQIYLAAIDKLNDYYRASPDLVISIAPIQTDGSFVLEGDNLPREARFYRLYLMKEQNREYDACLYFGLNDHNFIHIVLHNESQLKINAAVDAFSPFGNYKVKGDITNQLMQQLSNMVYPSVGFYDFRFPIEQKLSAEKLQQDLKYFADTCSISIVSLAAVNYTDFEQYFDIDRDFYEDFGQRLKQTLPNSIYTKNYFRKLNYYAFEDTSIIPIWAIWVIGVLGFGLLAMSGLAYYFYRKFISVNGLPNKNTVKEITILYDKLTLKEREILALIQVGKANKEIANELFIGVSTVKTHINKIYAKLEVRSRKEAVSKMNKGLGKI